MLLKIQPPPTLPSQKSPSHFLRWHFIPTLGVPPQKINSRGSNMLRAGQKVRVYGNPSLPLANTQEFDDRKINLSLKFNKGTIFLDKF